MAPIRNATPKTVPEQTPKALGGGSLFEASLGRIWQHHNTRAFVILTAWRATSDRKANDASLAALKTMVHDDGHGFIPIEGIAHLEAGDAREPSLLVVSDADPADPDGALLRKAIAWATRCEQCAVFYHVVRDGKVLSAIVDVGSGDAWANLGAFTPSELGAFFVRLKASGAFVSEWIGVKYRDPPQNYLHGMALQAEGEERFDLRETFESWLTKMGAR